MFSIKNSTTASLVIASVLGGSLASQAFVAAEPGRPHRTVNAPTANVVFLSDINGQWTASIKGRADQVEVMFLHRSPKYGVRMEFETIPVAGFRGSANSKTIDFNIVREAGTFRLKGHFNKAKGSGDWDLSPAPGFIAGMRTRGYGDLSPEDLYSAAIADLRLKLVDELKSEGYGDLTFHELFEAATFGITPGFIRSVRASGHPQPSFEKLVEIKIQSKSK